MGDASARPVISEKAHAECVRLLDLLTNKRVQESWSWVFMSPVAGIPGYHDVIKKPMDLGTVKKNLGSKPSRCRFKSHEKFAKDVRLVFQNALVYNKGDEQVKGSVFDAAQHLLRVFENAYTKAKETVFKDEDDAAEHNSSTNEEPDAAAAASTADGSGSNGAEKEKSRHHSSSSGSGGHAHGHSHSSSEHESSSSSKHKKDKSSKKEKKSKKSKKKSKDKDKERDRDKHKERSSKDREKDKDRERKSSSASAMEDGHKKSHATATVAAAVSSTSSTTTHKTSSSSRDHDQSVPAGVSATDAAKPKPAATAVASSLSSSQAASTIGGTTSSIDGKMSEETVNACLGVLMKLIKYKEGNVSPAAPFLQPVDLTHFPDYKIKVPNRMHLYGVQKKLKSGGYVNIDTFAYDVRLVFSNCLVYNGDVVLSKVIRSHAVTLIKLFETQFAKIGGSWPGISERWKCHQIIHEILANRTDGHETAQWFKYPIETYFDSADQVPYGYFKKIKYPMDLGTVSAKLHLGIYHHVPELLQDLKLIFDNCLRYWSPDPHGVAYCESAKKLLDVLKTQSSAVFGSHVVDKVMSKDKASKSSSSSSSASAALSSSSTSVPKDRKGSSSSVTAIATTSSAPVEEERSRKRSSKHISSNLPQKETCMEILKSLRQHKMRGYNDIEIPTAGPFLHAVDVTKYPDYLQVVSEPMDFAKIERKLKGDRYSDLNEFSADVHLIFSNCHKYNSDPIEGADIRAMASNLRDYFVDLYNEKFGNGEKAVRATTSVELVKLPSAKLEASRAQPKAAPPPVVKKAPLSSPSKHSSVTTSGHATAITSVPEEAPVSTFLSKAGKSSSSAAISVGSGDALPALSSSLAASASKSSTAQMTPQELEEYKKRKKEKKEKKEKKDKKKKDKKEKKKKDKDKKDKKERDKSPHGRGEAEPQSAGTRPAVAPTSAPPAMSSKAASTSNAASSAAASAPPTRQLHVPSKISPAESSTATSKSKTKKTKKSELSGWEAVAERVLNRLAKIEQVAKLHFDQPLLEVFPHLELDYRRLVPEAMDLRTLRDRLHDHSLGSAVDFMRLGRMIFQNAIKFNCAPDPASTHVREMSAHLLWYFESLCSELKLTDSASAGSKLEDLRRQRAEIVNNTPMEVKAKECQKLLRVLNSQKYDKNCWPFRKPAQVLFPTLPPEYFEIIKTPMDLATISDKLTAVEYKLHGEFIRDVRLTFENAIRYNHADKDRDGWNVYSAAVQMLAVAEEQWCDVTLEVLERVRRREIVRKQRDRLGEKPKSEKRHDGESRKAVLVTHSRSSSSAAQDNGLSKAKTSASHSEPFDASAIAKASITIAPPSSKDDAVSSTNVKLIVKRPTMDRVTTKSERKAEEKARKRLRREEEIARTEKRRRTAVAATDDALREAELRSRRRIQKLEIAEAVKQREERERQQREDEATKTLAVKMKFNSASWSGQLAPSGQSFWLRKPSKLHIPAAFQPAVGTH